MNENGDIKFRTGLIYEGVELNKKLIDHVVLGNVTVLDYSAPYLSQFMFGSANKEEVYSHIFPHQAQITQLKFLLLFKSFFFFNLYCAQQNKIEGFLNL